MIDEAAAVRTTMKDNQDSNHEYHSNHLIHQSNPNVRLLPSRNCSKRKILIHNNTNTTTSNARNMIDMMTPSMYNIETSNMVNNEWNNDCNHEKWQHRRTNR